MLGLVIGNGSTEEDRGALALLAEVVAQTDQDVLRQQGAFVTARGIRVPSPVTFGVLDVVRVHLPLSSSRHLRDEEEGGRESTAVGRAFAANEGCGDPS